MNEVKCAHCGSTEFSVDLDDYEDGQGIQCGECQETNYVWCGQLVDADTYHESYCDSQAAARYEDAAYGDDREEDFTEGRWESGYRNGREDFRSDC